MSAAAVSCGTTIFGWLTAILPSTSILRAGAPMMPSFDFFTRTRVVFAEGALARLGELARELGFTRTLIVADRGLVAVGYVKRAAAVLEAAGIESFFFYDFDSNPDTP